MECSICAQTFTRRDNLIRHQADAHDNTGQRYFCDVCDYSAKRNYAVKRHRLHKHQLPTDMEPKTKRIKIWRPWEEAGPQENGGNQQGDHTSDSTESGTGDPTRLDQIMQTHWGRIRTYVTKTGRRQDRYNFQLRDASSSELLSYVEQIFSEQNSPFKLNVGFGFILQNMLTDELTYYYASNNNRLLPSPILIKNRTDLQLVADVFDQEDLLEYCRKLRPNTKWIVVRVTNALFYVNKLINYPIGAIETPELPVYLRNKRSLIAFDRNRRGERYRDNLCFFRCLAYHQDSSSTHVTRRAEALLHTFSQVRQTDPMDFQGLTLDDLPIVEDLFDINVEVYKLNEIQVEENDALSTVHQAEKVRSSRANRDRGTMYLNLYENHFSYILDIAAYSTCWVCGKCGKMFNRRYNAATHERNCAAKTTLVFPGGGYGQPKSVFDLLLEEGIDVPKELQFFPYRLTFDFECFFKHYPAQEHGEARKEVILSELVPASVSVCSNVPGYTEPKCFVSNGDPHVLMHEMYDHMRAISSMSYRLMCERFEPILSDLSDRIEDLAAHIGSSFPEEDVEGDENVSTETKAIAFRVKVYEKLLKDLNVWLERIVALGFNSGKFDFNLIRRYLFPYFIASNVPIESIIKKNNDYLSITTPHVTFLDVKNYLAAGITYDRWIRSYHIPESKGKFPYEWFTGLEKLAEPELPQKQEFWSTLKQQGISDEEYEELKQIWAANGFRNMKDLLVWYNNLDVEPFLQAAEKLFNYWKNLDIDPFKGGAISLPGLAMTYLVKHLQPHTILPLFSEKTKSLYHLLRENIVGGLSIVMHRYHEAGLTKLPNGSLVEWIYSFDCNSLYLWALGEPTGTGIFGQWNSNEIAIETPVWKATNDDRRKDEWVRIVESNMKQKFRRWYSHPYCKKEVEWLEWMIKTERKKIEHRFNGRQKVIRVTKKVKYPVDGFSPQDRCVYQFHGCYWHGHGCHLDGNDHETRAERYQNTVAVTQQLRNLEFTVVEKWECEWEAEKKRNPLIVSFLNDHLSLALRCTKLTAGEIISKVTSGEFFGIVECDIEVPRWNTNLIEFFEEFPPICKNTEISLADVGDHMRTYAEDNGYMRKPRRNLINSYWGRKILLTTPLIRWYLKNGLVITKIYQAIEMKARSCFSSVRDEIADHRRRADADPDYKPIGESWKTLGNSTYGRAMTSKERHKDNMVVPDLKVDQYTNDKRFHKMEEVGDTAYEISMDKKRIKIDLPLTVAFFVYNYAKLRMVEFVYDFLKKYLRPGSYQLVCSDTDSIIAAYERRDIDDLVKPEMLEEYLQMGKSSFLSTDAYKMRTPGLFKEEMSATGIVALCSKTYFAWNDTDKTSKISSKGLSKRTNRLGKTDFMAVLQTMEKGKGTNYGFKVKGDKMINYKQEREGLAYLYVKRRVQDDGISTKVLHL